MKFHIYHSTEELLYAYALYFIQQANDYIASQGCFNIVLSGGSSPKRVYEILASPVLSGQLDWTKVNFFFGDERHVPADDARNNALMVEKALFKPLHIAPSQVFKINTSLKPKASAQDYGEVVSSFFKGKPIRFDLILLGLGDNAHTASLFPYTPILHEESATVSEVYLKEEDAYRISMSAPMINQAKHVAFLVFGKNKATALEQVINGERNPDKYPAQLIRLKTGEVHWFLDGEAAAGL
jgi:6-phosphogluconolactonase